MWVAAPALLLALAHPNVLRAAEPDADELESDAPLPQLEQLPGPPAISPPRVAVPSQRPRVGRFTSVQVNVAPGGLNIAGDAANEPSMAVDPTNRNHIVIGWRQFDSVLSNFRQAGWAASFDGGRSWRHGGILEAGVFRSDPVLGTDAQGNFYYSSLAAGDASFDCDFFISSNHGQSWMGPISAWGGDKQWIAIDRGSTSPGRGHAYQMWSTVGSCCGNDIFTRSTDGAMSFEHPISVTNSPHWGTMDVAPDGTLYAAGIDSRSRGNVMVAKSTSARERVFFPAFESATSVSLGGVVSAMVGPQSPNPDGLLGQVWIAVDPSTGPRSGWVYLCCSVNPPGDDPMDVEFSRSTDGGATWSAPVRINDDAAGAWQWCATMAVAPNGRIDVVWNDTRNSGQANISELHYSSSMDGGLTWLPNTRLSTPWDSHVGWPNQSKIGDYYHMVSDRVGADLAWAATFNGEQDVWFMRIGDFDCNGNDVGDATDIATGASQDTNQNGIPDECESVDLAAAALPGTEYRLLQNWPNPFNPATKIPFEAPPGRTVRLEILDVTGRIVRTLGGSTTRGHNELFWDGLDTGGHAVGSGIYMYRLTAPGFVAANRMVLIR